MKTTSISADHDCTGHHDRAKSRDSKLTFLHINHSIVDVPVQLRSPGIVIFVHGVNSDGEWYEQAEQGLCNGLNDRMRRRNKHLAWHGPESGQMTPVPYGPELTNEGYIHPKANAKSFIAGDKHFSPVIRFRWGYKANAEELQQYGDGIYLNEHDYWGGGPFANGCSALPDLWSQGMSDELLLWMQVNHLNPTNNRPVFSCPPRPYFALAALRLARLVEAIRKLQADVPITIVCHSQGNMIGIAAAFLGDRLAPVTDARGNSGRCVADSYVLCNPPYSLVKANLAEDWTQGKLKDRQGGTGRQTRQARIETLRAFFDIIRKPACTHPADAQVDKYTANEAHGYTCAADRARYGYGPQQSTRCRVTLYCCPHDQVIGSEAVQGIGWRGLSRDEIKEINGAGVFCQRVFSQGFEVGIHGSYHYWHNHHAAPKPGSDDFWIPRSPSVKYSIGKGLDANKSWVAKILTVGTAPMMLFSTYLFNKRINGLPPDDWQIPLEAPDLPHPFMPQSLRFGKVSRQFDEMYDPPGQSRDRENPPAAGSPYAGDHPLPRDAGAASDAPLGNAETQASLLYEDHARLRMQARREKLVAPGAKVKSEDDLSTASEEYKAWRNEKISTYLADNVDANATDHSTIMTNDQHAQYALAYDVAVGECRISAMDMRELREAADWRYLKELESPFNEFSEYFINGKMNEKPVHDWVHSPGNGATMPDAIADRREHPAPAKRDGYGEGSQL
jgi:pimeloyl-ACP methyl ester carboxylesterase